jgi:hypothetical protein
MRPFGHAHASAFIEMAGLKATGEARAQGFEGLS